MFEKRNEKILPLKAFIKRVFYNISIGVSLVILFLLIGMLGYSYFEGMNGIDAFLNAAMILSGMGPVSSLKTEGGKIFAGTYALFSGVVFLGVAGIFIAPLFHRFFHKFLLKDK